MTPPPDQHNDEMSEYLQMFLDETEEQLDGVVEALLVLEDDADDTEALNEAFRLIHSIKGSAGMMGYENIGLLTHHLESRFELFRSHVEILDAPTMNLVLRCIDFLRECVARIRGGEELGPIGPLLDELRALEVRDASEPSSEPESTPPAAETHTPPPSPEVSVGGEGAVRVVVHFEPGLALVDLKARLIHSRLSKLGDVLTTTPPMEALESLESSSRFELALETDVSGDELREAADADGVASVEIPEASAAPAEAQPSAGTETPVDDVSPAAEPEASAPESATEPDVPATESPAEPAPDMAAPKPGRRRQPAETMRVDVERLDALMNLAGELVVNRARFAQIAERVTPALRSRNSGSRAREFADGLRRTIAHLEGLGGNGEWRAHIEGLAAGLELMEEQTELWENGRRSFLEIGEAIDQLTRVSDSLQRGVLGTRMVPVAPLFTRFKRVVRDLSSDSGKQVALEIRGEKTELDKRMIDELGDPLVHLVRNSIDHGLESPEVRTARGKPEEGTVRLEARHSGNSVFIDISDDGGGIDVGRIREKVRERGLLDAAGVKALTDAQALDYIWHPGFSTAQAVTDISGRGVGMDAVKTRITELNGTVDVDTTPAEGTVFTIRLPLTLAIIHSLLMRIRGVAFSMPIEDVQEIVDVSPGDVVFVHGHETIDVRGAFIPLISIDDVFDWNDLEPSVAGVESVEEDGNGPARAVILQTGGRMMGLRVDALIGRDDLVIKSLSQNFIHIRGLSGASILGDGTVCLMLDVTSVIERALNSARRSNTR